MRHVYILRKAHGSTRGENVEVCWALQRASSTWRPNALQRRMRYILADWRNTLCCNQGISERVPIALQQIWPIIIGRIFFQARPCRSLDESN
jgi:hypothetical protein